MIAVNYLPAIKLMWAALEPEVADRGRRRIERHLASARLPAGKTFDTFDFNAVPSAWPRSGHVA
jgi:DNA replication protein DnaC